MTRRRRCPASRCAGRCTRPIFCWRISLAGGSGTGHAGSTAAIVLWLGATAAAAVVVLTAGRRLMGTAVADGLAGGLFFSIGDISTKIATQGGARATFVITLIAGYTLGTSLLQLGYQAGGALTVAGLATLLTNAVPIPPARSSWASRCPQARLAPSASSPLPLYARARSCWRARRR